MSFIPDDILKTIESVAKIVTDMAGIQLGPKQYAMMENRLKTRMSRIGISDFKAYLEYLKNHAESESQVLLSLMTTHHTYFFREFAHFEFLLNKSLPILIEVARKRHDKTIHILSAACSRGQESYSLAMFFSFHLNLLAPDINFTIWGTDIDPESVEFAKNGVYRNDQLNQVPSMYLGQHWSRGQGDVKDYSRVKKSLKEKCHFAAANLFNYQSFLSGRKFDIIFCRNVFIYFNSEQIKQVTKNLLEALEQSGHLFLGVSETLNGLDLKIQSIGPSIYQHPKIEKQISAKLAAPNKRKEVLDVLCVDDSPVIHTLLKKILVPNFGFRVKATAKNGQEALDLLSKNDFDIITLDLHMPVLDGVQFLQKYKNKTIPIVVISSINRDDLSIAQKAVSLGASDYVEKPSLENLAQAGNEIRSKLNSSYTVKQATKGQKPTEIKSPPQESPDRNSNLKVLIVDDSSTIRALLRKIISKDSRFEIIAEAGKPSEVLEILKKVKPDVMTLDIHMPEMDGVTLLKKIHPLYKIPTVMITSVSREEGTLVLEALENGAVDYIQKPDSKTLSNYESDIHEKLLMAAGAQFKKTARAISRVAGKNHNLESLIVIGASTGGTEALKHVLLGMPKEIPPILIVQHIPPVFSYAFASRLNDLCPFEVKEAADGDEIQPNKVFVAPGGKQMGLRRLGERLLISIKDDLPVNRHKPSVDYLFDSVSRISVKPAVAVILTGMGADGAKGMKKLRDLGFRTIGQDAATSVVYGMPKEAKNAGGVEYEMPLERIAAKISELIAVDENIIREKVG
jgi:chemotaxis response regulator CheB/chemotaxis methyl-accepting protein methylase